MFAVALDVYGVLMTISSSPIDPIFSILISESAWLAARAIKQILRSRRTWQYSLALALGGRGTHKHTAEKFNRLPSHSQFSSRNARERCWQFPSLSF
jgi:hypothetical protein